IQCITQRVLASLAALSLYLYYRSSPPSSWRRQKRDEEIAAMQTPLIMRVVSNKARMQSVEWAMRGLRVDEDGDVAHEFISVGGKTEEKSGKVASMRSIEYP